MKIVNFIIFFSVISSFAGSKVQLPEGRSWYNHHFAMTNWFYKYSFNDPELHAKILAEGGYQGAMLSLKDSKERWDMLPRYIESFKKHQLAITAIHCRFYIEDGTYPEIIKNNLHLLKNSPVLLIPSVGSRKKLGRRDPEAVEMAVKILQEMSDDAKKYNLGGVATYIHINNWIETIDDGIFIAEKANRDNVGTIFHLHHWTKVEMRQHKKNSS
ncbi:MAG: hypothetical protein NE327_00770, partial [Lentisphaeraceae bacterium]|nr:hypothetical protein [Lentisphaeraceae bacterium]